MTVREELERIKAKCEVDQFPSQCCLDRLHVASALLAVLDEVENGTGCDDDCEEPCVCGLCAHIIKAIGREMGGKR